MQKINLNNWDFFAEIQSKNLKLKKIFCGFSGGADSTALLLYLLNQQQKYKFTLKAVHFQHGLRGEESLQDAIWCRRFCENRKIDFLEINLHVKSALKGSESFEDLARKLRLKYWSELADSTDSAVALGHNSDDRNENLIIRLIRGSNVSGLTSLRTIQKINQTLFLRPLLPFSREEIEEYLTSQGISDWRKDSTNEDNTILRNYIRNIIISELSDFFPGAKEGLRRAAKALEDDALFIEEQTEKVFPTLLISTDAMKISEFDSLHPALKIRILRKFLSDNLQRDYIPNNELLVRVDSAIKQIRSSTKKTLHIPLPDEKNAFISIEKTKILFSPQTKIPPAGIEWNWKINKSIKWGNWTLNASIIPKGKLKSLKLKKESSALFSKELPEKLHITPPLQGEHMIPFGSNQKVRLKKIFESKKIPARQKIFYPVLRIPNTTQILWIPNVRRSNLFPANLKENIIQISAKQNTNDNA